ncbi:hypothetical protein A4A49_59161, partial [Nicotiana attenuata]
MASSLFFILLVIPHSPGLAYVSPVPFSPEAYSFFHTHTQQQNTSNENLCDSSESECSEFHITASNMQSNLEYEKISPPEGGEKRLGGGGMTRIPIGFLFAILLGVGILFVVITRKRNSSNANPVLQLNV